MKNIKTYEQYKGITFNDFLKQRSLLKTDISVYCNNNGLVDLIGVEKFTRLELLYCPNNDIPDLTPVDKLKNLKELYINNNKITYLEPLENLTNLIRLHCNNNQITSLNPISNLTKLVAIYCQYNPIDWVDYIDKQGNTWYIVLPKSIKILFSDKFDTIDKYWEFMDKNQPAGISRKFNF